jgi:cytochrome c biogenesis protein CcmG/thiol:disulfide interchange protein DsbE
MMRFILPLVLFLVLAGILFKALSDVSEGKDPKLVPSPFIDRPAPAFSLSQLHEPAKTFSPADMKGRVWLFNLWASWCVSCRDEHPVLLAIAQQNIVPIVGLDYKDKAPDAEAWLSRGGNPYLLNATDPEGRIGIDYGITGVPETFVIDKQGVIRYKEIGVITPQIWKDKILPLVTKLEQQP